VNKIDQSIQNLRLNLPGPEVTQTIIDLDKPYDVIKNLHDSHGKSCGIDQISDLFSWKKGFSYLFTGSPNTGKTTMVLYLYLLMSLKYGYKWCVWSPEMEDSYLDNKVIEYHAKDLIYTLIWTLSGITPYQFYAKKHTTNCLAEEEIRSTYSWICEHFKFIHIGDRTPAGIMEAFKQIHERYGVDGYLLDPWKSVKQNMDKRSDLWLEDALMEFKTFSLETDSIMNYIVHPKSMRDFRDANGNFRVITPFDLNGGAAWHNSMDVIISMRRIDDRTEWHSQKIRKQHLVGRTGMYESIFFDRDKYRFTWGNYDPFQINVDFTSGDVNF
jgi:hypothetical protein